MKIRPKKSTRVLVVVNPFMEYNAQNLTKRFDDCQPFYARFLYHKHFGQIISTFNENNVSIVVFIPYYSYQLLLLIN